VVVAIATNTLFAQKGTEMSTKKEEFEIPATEDLMREHGILNRSLLIYEEIIKQINGDNFQPAVLKKTVEIVKSFIEDYHEKLEENYIFPLFEKKKTKIQLIKTLKNQHNKGRTITDSLLEMLTTKKIFDQKDKKRIQTFLQKYITMYRPHEAREDTVLFPLVRSLISEKEFEELGEMFEKIEHKLFGETGFESIVAKIAAIEKELGIYNLEQFTP
jgi:hemerythrin-like domain-containing protein